MKSILMNCLLILGVGLFLSCNSNPAPKAVETKAEAKARSIADSRDVNGNKIATVQNLNPQQFKNIIRGNSSAVVIDVRTPNECQGGIYKNALMLNYNDGTFEAKLKDLDKGNAYLMYCASGGRSAKASQKMIDLGFEKVYNLEGGYDDIK